MSEAGESPSGAEPPPLPADPGTLGPPPLPADPGSLGQSPLPAPRPWIVRALGPRPASTAGARIREILRRTAWYVLLEFVSIQCLWWLGIHLGNAGGKDIMKLAEQGPLYTLALGVLLFPCLEELVFRGIPSWVSNLVLRRRTGQRWRLGFAMSLCFALGHSLVTQPSGHSLALGSGLHFEYGILPIPQFLLGLLLWDFARRYGVWASALSHAAHNAIFLIPISCAVSVP